MIPKLIIFLTAAWSAALSWADGEGAGCEASGSERAGTRGRPKEESMTALMKNLIVDDAGQDLAEYGIALAVIGVLAGAAAIVIANDVGTPWSRAQNVIDSAAS